MRRFTAVFAFLGLVLVPAAAFAQATITGVVRDGSGAVLPGVLVEAASDALIEKVRSAVTDGTGQFRIIDLRPGTYSVTFTLTGFRQSSAKASSSTASSRRPSTPTCAWARSRRRLPSPARRRSWTCRACGARRPSAATSSPRFPRHAPTARSCS